MKLRRAIIIDVEHEGDSLRSVSTMEDDYHAMRLELAIDLKGLVITEARAEMSRHPYTVCPGATASIGALVGVRFGLKVKRAYREAIARESGCTHIGELADNTFDYLVQKVFWDGLGQEVPDRQAWEKMMFSFLNEKNTCHAFNATRNFFPGIDDFLPQHPQAEKEKP